MIVDPSIAALASTAVATLIPYLKVGGEGAAKKLGEESAKSAAKLMTWLRERFSDSDTEALTDLEKAPEDSDNQAYVRKRLQKLLLAEPAFARELEGILPTAIQASSMTQNISGDGNKAAQIRGSGNTTSIS